MAGLTVPIRRRDNTYAVRYSQELGDRLEQYARRLGYTHADMVNFAVEAYLNSLDASTKTSEEIAQ